MINFNASKLDRELISAIVTRAKILVPELDYLDTSMDIAACHCNGNPLQLGSLLDTDDSNFLHDILGINRHIDRRTGKLKNCFLPRFSK